ncbi:MAG: PorT family protein [Bacteroidia bacterium]|nr:PorT family protein [Bacteroidia bacterium]
MKKKFRILLILLACSRIAYAQDTNPPFQFGLKLTPNIGWLKSDDKEIKSDGSRFGISYGLIADFGFGENYAFATGIDVAYRGGKTKGEFNSASNDTTTTTITETDMKLQYIEFPISLKFKTNEIGQVRYYVQAGLGFGINIRARADIKETSETFVAGTSIGTTSFDEENIDINESINAFNMSMIIGGGIEYNISGNTNLLVGLVFNNGFMDIADGGDYGARSNYFGLNLGVLF